MTTGIQYGVNADEETGASLRRKLEEAISDNKTLSKELRQERTSKALSLHSLVAEADLADVPLDEVEARAAQLQEARSAQKETLLRESLKERGLDDEAIDAFMANEPGSEDVKEVATIGRIRDLARVAGTPPARVIPEGMTPKQKIEFALEQNERKTVR